MSKWGAIVLAGAALMAAQPGLAEKLPLVRSEVSDGAFRMELVDLTPRFMAFHGAAKGIADPAARFALWQEHYGFAAVPPGPQGEQMAREMLDEAWPQYGAHIEKIGRGAATFGSEPMDTLKAVARLLDANEPIDLRFVTYIGAFDDNAFVAGVDGRPIVNFPVEMAPDRRRPVLPHEMTHAVHMKLAKASGGWERTIAATLLQEGLAMHVARELSPGEPITAYVEHRPGWWADAEARRGEILSGILPALGEKDGETVFRFTMGNGPAGIEREAYAAGWFVVEYMRESGMSLAEIARISEADMPAAVGEAIGKMVADAPKAS
jgi:hypothetical protein